MRGSVSSGASPSSFVLVATATLACLWTSLGAAQSVTVEQLKAAFIYNFAKFTDWPGDALPSGHPLALCTIGDKSVSDTLAQTVKGRVIEGHEVTVTVLTPDAAAAPCHLLYVSAGAVKSSAALLASLKEHSVLTVSDGDRFANTGGIAQLIVENGKMRFAINVVTAQRSGLHLSSKLLSLATIVKDNGNDARH